MKKTITRKYAVSLLKQGKAVFSCFRKPDENGIKFSEIESVKTGRKMQFVYDIRDIVLAMDYSLPDRLSQNLSEDEQ